MLISNTIDIFMLSIFEFLHTHTHTHTQKKKKKKNNILTSQTYHQQQNKWYPKSVYLPISKLHSLLAVANLIAHLTYCYVIMGNYIRYGLK